jgi:hypothetical protein
VESEVHVKFIINWFRAFNQHGILNPEFHVFSMTIF